MNTITIKTKTNGYKAEGLQKMITRFEKVAADLFPGCTIRHFYYGDYTDMVDIVLGDGNYAHFNIYSKRVSLCGYSLTSEQMQKCASMTHNDECYNGKLIELAGF